MTDSRMRDEDGFLTEHDPEPTGGFFPKWENVNPPNEDDLTGRCSKCLSNTVFERDPQYPDILSSVCCSWPPLNLPEEP